MRIHPMFLPMLSALIAGRLFAASIGLTPVPAANPKTAGQSFPNVLSPELYETIVAQGSNKLENPSALTSYYGYDNDGPMLPAAGATPAPGKPVEATKTEPDKNTYLVLTGQHGPDPSYHYGTHFLFQGHEVGTNGQGYITRINLEADAKHRVTLMAVADVKGVALPVFDGSTWYPFSRRLLFTAENGASGGVWQATAGYPSEVEDISGILGRGGYEGIQADNAGRILIIEDASGSKGTAYPNARRPNSFLYRFLPYDRTDLKKGGKLQALQVTNPETGKPIVFGASADADIKSDDSRALHTYGLVFPARWLVIHDTAVDGFTPFDANAAAKKFLATPFKRTENGQFRPGSNFTEFYFDTTGDTDNRTEAGSTYGGFGAIFRLFNMSGDSARLSLFYLCDQLHSGFDNVAFWDANHIVFVEDAGDTLHTQRNALDSAYAFDVNTNYANGTQPERILAEGRDPSATLDSALLAFSGTNNEGDNEITGWHVSDGDPTANGLLGAKIPTPFRRGWRVFWTQQHGDNITWEVLHVDESPSPEFDR